MVSGMDTHMDEAVRFQPTAFEFERMSLPRRIHQLLISENADCASTALHTISDKSNSDNIEISVAANDTLSV